MGGRLAAVAGVLVAGASVFAVSAAARPAASPVVLEFQEQYERKLHAARTGRQALLRRRVRENRRLSEPRHLRAAPVLRSTAGGRSAGAGRPALSDLDRAVLRQVNAVRTRHGLRPLAISPALTAAARHHSEDMIRRGFFAHGAFDRRIRRFYPQMRSAGENIAYGVPDLSAEQAMNLWMKSPPHRRNILNPRWREIGIAAVHASAAPGAYDGDPTTVVTTDFGAR